MNGILGFMLAVVCGVICGLVGWYLLGRGWEKSENRGARLLCDVCNCPIDDDGQVTGDSVVCSSCLRRNGG
jgi:hypothetical protein